MGISFQAAKLFQAVAMGLWEARRKAGAGTSCLHGTKRYADGALAVVNFPDPSVKTTAIRNLVRIDIDGFTAYLTTGHSRSKRGMEGQVTNSKRWVKRPNEADGAQGVLFAPHPVTQLQWLSEGSSEFPAFLVASSTMVVLARPTRITESGSCTGWRGIYLIENGKAVEPTLWGFSESVSEELAPLEVVDVSHPENAYELSVAAMELLLQRKDG